MTCIDAVDPSHQIKMHGKGKRPRLPNLFTMHQIELIEKSIMINGIADKTDVISETSWFNAGQANQNARGAS
jgi:ketol-acid reductoisomerase